MVEVLVEYDYTAKEPDELTIRRGDVIRDVSMKAGGWWEGTLHDRRGMFPDNFVKEVVGSDGASSAVVLRSRRDSARIRQCRVVFSYRQDHEDELDLNVGDIIDILGEEEEGWWRGALRGKEGVFPSNFVEEIAPIVSKPRPSSRDDLVATSLPNDATGHSPNLPAKPSKILCEVKYPYKAENTDELTLKEGDIITLISRDGEDIGWWKGELNGKIGVFPDNFVAVLSASADDTAASDEKLNKSPVESGAPKPISLASQRKSLENKADKSEVDGVPKSSPPIPGKKPSLAVKKSPSSIISGIKKKIAGMADAVDGGSASKPAASHKTEVAINEQPSLDNSAFDQVERRPLLSDVRATRAKGPGRRPPSVVYKEGEPGVVNGNLDHVNLDILAEQISNTTPSTYVEGESELKPKLREWEKHKAPWLEEMKLNQAKRTSTSPGPENRLKLTPTDRASSELEETKSNKTSPYEKEAAGLVDMSKSMTSLSGRLKTPPNELEKVPLRAKPKLPVPARPQTVHNLATNVEPQKLTVQATPSPVVNNRSPSPMQKLPTANHTAVPDKPLLEPKPVEPKPVELKAGEASAAQDTTIISHKQYQELIDRIEKLEALVEMQNEIHLAKMEELRGKLQIESDMRMMLQAELEKVSQCVMQV